MRVLERTDTPRLLVSVRSVEEASAALTGGCDILDIKEPSRGSLGIADSETMLAICRFANSIDSNTVPVSAALGETADWLQKTEFPALPDRLTYCKLGTANLAATPNWQERWIDVRRRFDVRDGQWIAVAYADWQQAESPVPTEVVTSAIETTCAGVLFDTFAKDGRTLLDWLTPSQLRELIERIHSADLFVALAGNLRVEQFPRLVELAPDVIAVRTAVCAEGERAGPVCAESVAAMRDFLHQTRGSFFPA